MTLAIASCTSGADVSGGGASGGSPGGGGAIVGPSGVGGGAGSGATPGAGAGSAGSAGSGGSTDSPGTGGRSSTGGAGGTPATGERGGESANPSTGGATGPAGGATQAGGAGRGGGGGRASLGTGGSGGSSSGVCGSIPSTLTRPQLTSVDAANLTIQKYLAQSDSWNPTVGLGSSTAFTASFTVAADGSGTHASVQAAIAAATSGSARRYILIKPGVYRGAVSIAGSTPITLYGADTDATRVVIVNNQSATSAGSTAQSATVTATADGLQLMNLTISNDFATPAAGTNLQAVALYTTGDKNVLQNVRLHGFQDTLFTDTASETRASRVYIKDSFIEGDTDFIFGGATLVIDGGTIHYLSSRKTSGGGACLAPSTRTSNSYGFLVIGCNFTADATALPNKVSLGRSWDEGGITPTPNGQALVRESVLGVHIRKLDPWASAATSARPYSASGNRFSEYCDSGPGSGP
jgi:pectinesterase